MPDDSQKKQIVIGAGHAFPQLFQQVSISMASGRAVGSIAFLYSAAASGSLKIDADCVSLSESNDRHFLFIITAIHLEAPCRPHSQPPSPQRAPIST